MKSEIQPYPRNQSKAVRAAGTVYQNTTGKPMLITIRLYKAGGAAWALVENANPPTIRVAGGLTAQNDQVTILVIPGYYYKFDVDSIDGDAYTEWY